MSDPRRSIGAYDDIERIRGYDRDMDLLHPNRHRMIDIALQVLSELDGRRSTVLELGSGTGLFACRFLERHREATLVGVDGAASMIEIASGRLRDAGFVDRMRFIRAGFQTFRPEDAEIGQVDAVFSSYALHHLDRVEKSALLARVVPLLKPGAWILNADLTCHADPEVERIIQEIRVRGIVERNAACCEPDSRLREPTDVRAFLDALEAEEGDRPLPIEVDLALLRESGLANVTVFWQEYREAVFGGRASP